MRIRRRSQRSFCEVWQEQRPILLAALAAGKCGAAAKALEAVRVVPPNKPELEPLAQDGSIEEMRRFREHASNAVARAADRVYSQWKRVAKGKAPT